VAEAGWEPVTYARSSDEQVYVERFGDRFLTVFNDSDELKSVTITVEGRTPGPSRDLVRDEPVVWEHRVTRLTIAAEDVAVIEMD
jgi:hypothetical protein